MFQSKNPTEEQIRKYKRSEKELDKKSNSSFKYVCSDLMSKIIKNCRGVKKSKDGIKRKEKEKDRKNFRSALYLKEHDIIITKEDSVISKIMKVFAKKKMKLQHSVLNYYIDVYFPKYRLAVEIDEKGHLERDENK